jgi:RNA polymerase sigma factor (sigma-70 family)
MTTAVSARQIEQLLRELAPQVLGRMTRRFQDFSASEDAVQEALLTAATVWPAEGLPVEPRAWLTRVAARRMVDHVRAETARRRREQLVVSLIPPEEQLALAPDDSEQAREQDDALRLLFMSCHPALTQSSAIALTLRAVGGLTTTEIAKAFFVPEATMAQRISRAKQTLREADASFELPNAEAAADRLPTVLHVLYMIFSEGYSASIGPTLQRLDLAQEALRLTRLLHAQLPHDAEVLGLLSLMLLTDARRNARSAPDGTIIPLDQQDRSAWDREAIAEGVALVSGALRRGAVGAYQLQAAIAAVHDEAESAEQTDWPQILALYDMLYRLGHNPMVALNHAVALAMVRGPRAGLERLAALSEDPRLSDHHRLHAVRAHLLERAGDPTAAIRGYLRAADRTSSTPERNYLLTRAAHLRDRENRAGEGEKRGDGRGSKGG